MKLLNNYFLIGPMGAGKTAVGKQLAKLLDIEFYDTDEEIESRTGVDIPFIFEKEGESGFRKRESEILSELTKKNNIVLATGGGAIQSKENRKNLMSKGTVIYLKADIQKQFERTLKGKERPLLNSENPKLILENLMKIREPFYQNSADITITTDDRKISSVAREIMNKIN
tara:strand:- start:1692 stop:2204 length:513 start_codon:yes stop_codon:yes gene_type:complete